MFFRTVSDVEAELESSGVLMVNQCVCQEVISLWPLALCTSMSACVGDWVSSKRPCTLQFRAGVSSGNGSCRHG